MMGSSAPVAYLAPSPVLGPGRWWALAFRGLRRAGGIGVALALRGSPDYAA
jgi:hypothetical protein